MGKRCLLWDYKNTQDVPKSMDLVNWGGPISSVSNWNAWVPPELKGRAPFRPMVRSEGQLSGTDWGIIENTHEQIVHFFNEPERAGISTQHAADQWHKQMIPLRKTKGKKLVSPSCSNDAAGQAWIADFMRRVSDNPPDFLGLHYYGTDPKAAIQFIEKMHSAHPHQPVIVSEIASISRQKHEVFDFTAKLVNWMDDTKWVHEYGFFGCMPHLADNFVSPVAQLMNPDGSFTELMKILNHDHPIHV